MTGFEATIAPEWVVVDTSGWICFFARKGFPEIKRAISNLLDEDRVATTGPIFLELIQGTRTHEEREDTTHRLKALHWLKITDEHWHQASGLAFDLRRKGVTVSAIDAIIVTLTIDYNCELLHHDDDYDLIAKYSSLRVFDLTALIS